MTLRRKHRSFKQSKQPMIFWQIFFDVPNPHIHFVDNFLGDGILCEALGNQFVIFHTKNITHYKIDGVVGAVNTPVAFQRLYNI